MARGKLPAATIFYDANCRFRRLKGERGMRFSISAQMPPDDDHKTWWWSKPKKVTLSYPNDKTELLELAKQYRSELEQAEVPPVTVSQHIARWKEERKKQLPKVGKDGKITKGKLKQSTLDRERTTLAHIERYMGNMVVVDLTAQDITRIYNKMDGDGMSQSMQARVHGKLRQLLDQAVRDGYIKETPMDRVSPYAVPSTPPPDQTRHEERKITLDDANALMATIRKEPRDGLRAAIWMSYMLGLRRGECMGLKWSDFDESARTVHIQRQMSRRGETPPKTPKADRILPVAEMVLRYLLEWRDEQIRMYEKPAPKRDRQGRVTGYQKLTWSPDVYVCCNSDLREWKPNGNFNRTLRNYFVAHGLGEWAVDEAGKRHYHGVGLHSLRRAFCTSLIRKKVDVTSAQHLLGHSEPITTLRWYSDDTEDGMREAALQHAQQIMTPADEAEMIQDPDLLEWTQENM